jgi:hypothetical protein
MKFKAKLNNFLFRKGAVLPYKALYTFCLLFLLAFFFIIFIESILSNFFFIFLSNGILLFFRIYFVFIIFYLIYYMFYSVERTGFFFFFFFLFFLLFLFFFFLDFFLDFIFTMQGSAFFFLMINFVFLCLFFSIFIGIFKKTIRERIGEELEVRMKNYFFVQLITSFFAVWLFFFYWVLLNKPFVYFFLSQLGLTSLLSQFGFITVIALAFYSSSFFIILTVLSVVADGFVLKWSRLLIFLIKSFFSSIIFLSLGLFQICLCFYDFGIFLEVYARIFSDFIYLSSFFSFFSSFQVFIFLLIFLIFLFDVLAKFALNDMKMIFEKLKKRLSFQTIVFSSFLLFIFSLFFFESLIHPFLPHDFFFSHPVYIFFWKEDALLYGPILKEFNESSIFDILNDMFFLSFPLWFFVYLNISSFLINKFIKYIKKK